MVRLGVGGCGWYKCVRAGSGSLQLASVHIHSFCPSGLACPARLAPWLWAPAEARSLSAHGQQPSTNPPTSAQDPTCAATSAWQTSLQTSAVCPNRQVNAVGSPLMLWLPLLDLYLTSFFHSLLKSKPYKNYLIFQASVATGRYWYCFETATIIFLFMDLRFGTDFTGTAHLCSTKISGPSIRITQTSRCQE